MFLPCLEDCHTIRNESCLIVSYHDLMTTHRHDYRDPPFRIDIPQADLDDLLSTGSPEPACQRAPAVGARRPAGRRIGPARLAVRRARQLRPRARRALAYRVRLAGGRGDLNAHPHFTTTIDGQNDPLRPRPVARAERHPVDPHPRLAEHVRRVRRPDRPAHRSARPRRRPGDAFDVVIPDHPRLRVLRPDARAGLGRRAGRQGVGRADAPARLRALRASTATTPARSSRRSSARSTPSTWSAYTSTRSSRSRAATPPSSRGCPSRARVLQFVAGLHGAGDPRQRPAGAAADARPRARRLPGRPARVDRAAPRRPGTRRDPDQRVDLLVHQHRRRRRPASTTRTTTPSTRPNRQRCRSGWPASPGT